MLIDFNTMETTVIPHFRGGEKELSSEMYTDPCNKIMRGRLIPGASPKGHTHSLINDGGEDLVFFAVVPEHA